MRQVLNRAVALAGGQSQLARAIGGGVTQQQVWNWLHRDKRLPGERAIQIERALKGAIRREELRPDLFGKAEGDGEAAA